jgi:hypothetical protein
MKLEDFKHLETADATIDYSKLDASFWDSFSEVVRKNSIKFEKERKSITPTWEDMNRRFDF